MAVSVFNNLQLSDYIGKVIGYIDAETGEEKDSGVDLGFSERGLITVVDL